MVKGRIVGTELFLTGKRDRLFLNSALGCNSACSYCYLPDLQLQTGVQPELHITADALLERLMRDPRFNAGRDGTILSVGCFSECWDAVNRPTTLELLSRLLRFQNPIQFATKRRVRATDLETFAPAIRWKGQVTIFISCATLDRKLELRTAPPQERFKSFGAAHEWGIPAYLYLKPVLPGVTINDLPGFLDVVRTWGVDAVVGDRFSSDGEGTVAPIGDGLLRYEVDPEVNQISTALSEVCTVYKHSVEAINRWRPVNGAPGNHAAGA